jgi:hypothetical protein
MSDLPVISTHLPDLVDAYIDTRAQRLDQDKIAAQLKETEEELKQIIIAKYRHEGVFALGGTRGLVKMKESQEPTCTDWPALYAYIKANDAWEMLHKRVTVTAIKERWEAGETVSGVIAVPTYSLSVSKL